MKSTTRTRVLKSHPAIKALIARSFPDFKGRRVTVVQVDPTWTSTYYIDDRSTWCTLPLAKSVGRAVVIPRPTYGGEPRIISAPPVGCAHACAIVFQGERTGLEIVINKLDGLIIEPAIDAALLGAGAIEIGRLISAGLEETDLHRGDQRHYIGVLAAVIYGQAAERAAAVAS
jgi:hypothetical protein